MAFETVTTKTNSSVSSDRYDFEEKGQILEGRLVQRATIQTEFGPKQKYVVATAEGNKSILGSFQLDEKLALVDDGHLVRITFNGREKTKNGKVKLFDVQVDRSA